MKNSIRSIAMIIFTLISIAVLAVAQAVVPPPDGGYPGFNTAEGEDALLSLPPNGGIANTAVGWSALGNTSGASLNTAMGAGALLANNGEQNTATGQPLF
jgi:hypothetical protein